LKDYSDKLQTIKISYPNVEYSTAEFEKGLKSIASVAHRTIIMTNKKLCFFGDNNKVL
jgi:hypothetical protein